MNEFLYTAFEFPADWQTLLWHSDLAWVVPVVLILLSLWLFSPWFRRNRAERRVRESIQQLGKHSIANVSLDSGMEGFVFIDYLVLTPHEVLVITMMNLRGIIFGGDKLDSWARVVGRQTHKFPNPLVTTEERVLAVKYHVPEVPIRGVVLFKEGCAFPKGMPEGVLLPQTIPTRAEEWETKEILPHVQAAWDTLTEKARRGAEYHRRDLRMLLGTTSQARELLAVGLLIIAAAWVGAYLIS